MFDEKENNSRLKIEDFIRLHQKTAWMNFGWVADSRATTKLGGKGWLIESGCTNEYHHKLIVTGTQECGSDFSFTDTSILRTYWMVLY